MTTKTKKMNDPKGTQQNQQMRPSVQTCETNNNLTQPQVKTCTPRDNYIYRGWVIFPKMRPGYQGPCSDFVEFRDVLHLVVVDPRVAHVQQQLSWELLERGSVGDPLAF